MQCIKQDKQLNNFIVYILIAALIVSAVFGEEKIDDSNVKKQKKPSSKTPKKDVFNKLKQIYLKEEEKRK